MKPLSPKFNAVLLFCMCYTPVNKRVNILYNSMLQVKNQFEVRI